MIKIFFGLMFIFLSACSSLDWGRQDKPFPRSFLVHDEWVLSTLSKNNLEFRKINRMKPVLYKDTVIQSNALDGIAAFDKTNGNIKWKFLIAGGAESGAFVDHDKLYIGASDGYFYCLDAGTGKTIWSFPTRSENLSEPLVANGKVYFLSGNETFYALDAETGKQLWIYARQDLSSFLIRGGSRPAISGANIYIGFSDGYLVAINHETGALVWEKQLNKNKKFRDIDSNPLIDGDHLYVSGFDNAIYSLKVSSGEIEWKVEGGGYGAILLKGEFLFLANTRAEFLCLEKNSGKLKWSFNLEKGIATSAIMYKGMVVFGESQGSLEFLDALSGKEVAHYTPGRGILSEPTADEANKLIYFISNESNLYALKADWMIPNHIEYLR